ncbi:gliding motility-associated C-terminal domain-containing protein [Flavobacterium pectinovorum]|uniref:Gliding motility-associated C-terminal domain-containing protein n=1 Tax=Flavobacterium pectinovorum TaxID=29533 RepID=A0A502EYL7_9FLAO|nr:gliding motility-associated C-terminal domain-containing protein [Flavobacterium pectinovorum]TPG41680.1 gliding motility-associated C-terminal domain-containing protein [Flavobacterium pectinovorum]
MTKKYDNFLQIFLLLFFLSIFSSTIQAQCAGDDNSFSVCDLPNNANQTIDLFTKLNGTPIAGGVWADDDDSRGLDITTGILNAQIIRNSGVYHYTYTVTGVSGCTDTSATLEVVIGGYSGVSSNLIVCSDVKTYNLFQAFNGIFLGPQSNGQWHDDTQNVNVGSVVNVENLEGDFPFTYTMPARGTCPAMSSTSIITVKRAPKSGVARDLPLCASNGLTSYTNYDLENLLSGQDPGGTWSDPSNTGELSSSEDHFVDVQNIYNKFGVGDYYFTYKVLSKNTICGNAQSNVRIHLEKTLDFTGAVVQVNSDICETEIPTAQYSVTITRGNAVIPNGIYTVVFNVSGPRSRTETIRANFTNGVLIFPLDSSYFQQVGRFNVTILDILSVNSLGLCHNIINNLSDELVIYAIPDLEGASITPATVCQNDDATIQITDAVKLADGEYDVVYNISGANTGASQIARLTFVGGVSNDFIVPGFFNQKTGTSVVTITAITHVISQCVNGANLKGDILINPLPNASTLRLQVQDVCFGSDVSASVSGLGTLTNVTLSYVLSGSNTATTQTVALTSSDGNASFVIPANLLINAGATTISITKLTNNITTCSADVSGAADTFSLKSIPVAPAAGNQEFCKVDKATIANLDPKGVQYSWYDSATATTPLPNTYALKAENYYLRQTTLSCISEPTMIAVTINDTPAPILIGTPEFCGLDNPTIADLSTKTDSPSTVVWYDAPNNGNLLPSSTLLADKKTYYGFDFSTTTNCYSEQSTPATVSLKECDSPQYPFFIPDGFSPNGDGVNDVFEITNIGFLYPNYTIEIFNRYGNGMYKGGKDKPGWDGINYENKGLNGGVAPNGVYFYVINFNKDNKPPQQGRLYLNR